jgi:hypothetical protein
MPADVFAEGASVDLALENCFNNTRSFIMKVYEMSEAETIAIMSTGVDFSITQIVDGNWGVHAVVPKWMFASPDTPWDYTCNFNNPSGTRRALGDARARKLEQMGVTDEHSSVRKLTERVRKLSEDVEAEHLNAIGRRMFEAKVKLMDKKENPLMGKRVLKALNDGAKKAN